MSTSREEKFLMRQRGAAKREVKDLGFSLVLPGQPSAIEEPIIPSRSRRKTIVAKVAQPATTPKGEQKAKADVPKPRGRKSTKPADDNDDVKNNPPPPSPQEDETDVPVKKRGRQPRAPKEERLPLTEIANDAPAPPLKTIARKRVKAANALKTHEGVPKTTGRKRKIQITGSENPVKRSKIASASEESVTEEPQPLDGLRPQCEAQIPYPTNQFMTAAAPSPIVLPQMKPLRRRRGKATHEDEVCPKIPAARISHRNQDSEHKPDGIVQTETVKARKGRPRKELVALNALPLESTEAITTGKHARKTRVKRGRKNVAATASEEEEEEEEAAAAAAEGEEDPPHPPSSPAEGPKDPPTKALEDSAPSVVPAPSRRRGRKPKSQQSNSPPKTTPKPPHLLDDDFVPPPHQSSHQRLTKSPSPQATQSQRSLSHSSAQPPPTLPYTTTNANNDPPPPLPHQISLRAHLSHIIKSHQGLPARLSAFEAEAKRLRGTNSPSELGFKETREEIEVLLKRMEGVLRKGGEMLKERGKKGTG